MRSTLKYGIIIPDNQGKVSMKTKIIYISGSEIFDMHDIRAAFDQVRDALGLGMDTILFGVPVDKADALDADTTIPSVSVVQSVAPTTAPEPISEVTQQIIDSAPIVTADAPVSIAASEPATAPQKKSRGRPKSVKKAEKTDAITTAPEIDTVTPDVASDTATGTEKVVSILSVLTAKQDDAEKSDTKTPIEAAISEPVITDIATAPIADDAPNIDAVDDTPIEMEQIDVDTPITEDFSDIDNMTDITTDDAYQAVSIDDMITNDAPVASQKKTLEQLLESMTPLREDVEHEQHDAVSDSFDDIPPDDTPDAIDTSTDDDATLEQLATEFAENQDKIATTAKTENHGKIGKLKNILPFKKARRDDSGLMGDLFGWAGIAANDEDFAIPGFFTNAASKK